MKQIEQLLADGELISLRQGRSKKTYRYGETVLGVIQTENMAITDRDPYFILESILQYISGLNDCGIKTVDLLDAEVQKDNVVISTRYIPLFVDGIMAQNEGKFVNGATQLLNVLTKTKDSQVGIDPTPKNFAWEDGEILYADFYLPYTRNFIERIRSHMDLANNPRSRYLYFTHDYCFYPLVFAHAIKDITDLGLTDSKTVVDLVERHCSEKQMLFNVTSEFQSYLSKRTQLRQNITDL